MFLFFNMFVEGVLVVDSFQASFGMAHWRIPRSAGYEVEMSVVFLGAENSLFRVRITAATESIEFSEEPLLKRITRLVCKILFKGCFQVIQKVV